MKKLNFVLEDDLFKGFKKFCIDHDKTMTTMLIELIEKEIKSDPNINYLPVRYRLKEIEK